MIQCDMCRKEIEPWEAYRIFSEEGKRLTVCRDCRNINEWKGNPVMTPSKDNWEQTSVRQEIRTRPIGVTLLAILQIIGMTISIGVLAAIPLLLRSNTGLLLGMPLVFLLLIDISIMIPISFALAYGLLKGRDWARSYTKFFQIINIISALLRLNIFGIIIPIYVIYYLGKPHVVQFFDNKSALNSRSWPLVLVGCITLLIFTSVLAVYSNPLIQWDIQKKNTISSAETLLIGTWHNTDGSITLWFNMDHTCHATKENQIFNGTWSIEPHFYCVNLNWSPVFTLKHPNDPNLSYPVEQAYFIGNTLSLYTMFTSPSYYICTKIS